MNADKNRKKKIRQMKKAYDLFIGLALDVSRDQFHAAHLLKANSAYNSFIKELKNDKNDRS